MSIKISPEVQQRVAALTPLAAEFVRRDKASREGVDQLRKDVLALEDEHESFRGHLRQLSRSKADVSAAFHFRKRVVTNDCANHLAAVTLAGGLKLGKLRSTSESTRQRIASRCDLILGAEQRAALTTSDVPLPAEYESEVIQLVESYGAIRRWGTVYQLGRGTNSLPRLASSPAFGFIDMSASVPEKSPQIEFVEFHPEKVGGIIRIPSEIDEDSFVNLGNWLADYVARETARFEDHVAFNADGSSTYLSMEGVLKHALDDSRVRTLANGVSSPLEITLTDVRAMRWYVASAALINGAYYFHPSYESLFCSFNDDTEQGEVFVRGAGGDTLDNFPIRWVTALPPFDTADDEEALVGAFGDLSYGYLGERERFRVSTSLSAYFTVDQIALRAMERIDFHQMADDAMSALQLGAAL